MNAAIGCFAAFQKGRRLANTGEAYREIAILGNFVTETRRDFMARQIANLRCRQRTRTLPDGKWRLARG